MDLRSHFRHRAQNTNLRRMARPQIRHGLHDGTGITLSGNPLRATNVSNEALGTGDGIFLAADSGVAQQERRWIRRLDAARFSKISPVLDIIWYWTEGEKLIVFSSRLGRKEYEILSSLAGSIYIFRPMDSAKASEIDIFLFSFDIGHNYVLEKINLGSGLRSTVLELSLVPLFSGGPRIISGGVIHLSAIILTGIQSGIDRSLIMSAVSIGDIAFQYPQQYPSCNSIAIDNNLSVSVAGPPLMNVSSTPVASFYEVTPLAVSPHSYIIQIIPNAYSSFLEIKIFDQVFTTSGSFFFDGDIVFSELQDVNVINFPPMNSSRRYLEIFRVILNGSSLGLGQSKRINFPSGVPDFAKAELPKSVLFNTGNFLVP